VIVFASFMCNLILDGIVYSFGVFLPAFANSFGEKKGKVAWVGSLLCGVYLCTGKQLNDWFKELFTITFFAIYYS